MKIQTKHRYGKWEKQTNRQKNKMKTRRKWMPGGIAPQILMFCGVASHFR